MEEKKLVIKVAGHPDSTLRFYPLSSCGAIHDGVAFAHGDHGGWVISFADFEKMYRLVKEVRTQNDKEQS